MTERFEVRAHRSLWSDDVEILVRADHGNGLMSVGRSLMMERHEPGMLMQPTMRLDATAAQMLMDSLWECGLRPSEGSGSAGALAAMQKHLEDMRTLTFDLMRSNAQVKPTDKPQAWPVGLNRWLGQT